VLGTAGTVRSGAVPSLLVTNDFPPKIGGIQSVLWELWRRLPASETTVLTTPYDGDRAWDATQPYRVVRTRQKVLLPTPALRRTVDALAREVSADVVFVDPMLPVGAIGPRLAHDRYVVVAHGAEVTGWGLFPARVAARRVLDGAAAVVAFGEYPRRECERVAGHALPAVVIPPGVDATRFVPLDASARDATRARYGLATDRPLVLGLSRLVPRKGFDVLIRAAARVGHDVQVAIGGAGRDRRRLEQIAARHAVDVRFLGRVADAELPAVYACADAFAMLCRDRWFGIEAEGFGIVFLEAAACGVPQIAGRSGGSHEAVVDGETGFVVEPRDVDAVAAALTRLLGDDGLRARMGAAARARAASEFSYERLVARLARVARADFAEASAA
jgi:phosphatidylinositol alpha-1,6-mannosyltransferase